MARARTPLFLLVVALACVRNPATGERQLNFVSTAQEIEIGREGAAEIRQTVGLYDDQALEQYVERLGRRLAKVSERPELPWTFKVVDDATVNAFALPGGYIFVTRGILSHLNNEAQLAAVMGHEVGHVTAAHSANQLSKAQLASVGLGLGSLFVSENIGQLGSMGFQLLFLKFSRDDERQADELGIRYMSRAGYDPREMPSVFETLKRVSEAAEGGARLPGWLATHPDPEERVARTQRLVGELDLTGKDLVRGDEPLMRVIDGMAYGENPREGYFRDNRYYHPELGFTLELPDGWDRLNSKEAVLAVSPNEDAAFQLTLGPSMTPQEALRHFFTESGAEPLSEARKYGRAVGSAFRAQTEQGQVMGLIAFVSHGDHTYQLVGFSTGQGYTDTFARTFESFDELNDPALRNVKPNVLRVEKLEKDESLRDLHARHPGVSLAELARLNQVEENASFRQGTYVKWVELGQGTEAR